jgi:hypothetical protein
MTNTVYLRSDYLVLLIDFLLFKRFWFSLFLYIISGEVKLQASHRKGARISEQAAAGSIFYEPDSGDDWDEEDPDEDLNI